MLKKFIAIIIILIIVAGGGILIYNYQKMPDSINSSTNLINEKDPQTGSETDKTNSLIEITPLTHNFGDVIYGEVAKHIFTIKNIGHKPLEILRLSTSCGCTEATIAEGDKIIEPEKSVPMIVTFDPAVHKDDHDLGEVTRIVYIKTNDPKNPEIEVEIMANVVKKVKENKESISNESKIDEPIEEIIPLKTFEIIARQWSFYPEPIQVNYGDLVKLKITSVDVVHGFYLPDFGINERLEPGQTVEIEFTANKRGTFTFSCNISCGSGHSRMKGQLIVN